MDGQKNNSLSPLDEPVTLSVGGDRQAMERLLLACSQLVAGRLNRRLRDASGKPDYAQDILQETYLAAVYRIGSLRQHDFVSFRAWLLRISDNCAVDYLRRHHARKRGGMAQRELLELDELATLSNHPSSRARRLEWRRRLNEALCDLNRDQRLAVSLRWLEGKTVSSVARLMHRTSPAVRALVKRGLQQLRTIVGSGSKWLK
jgi:RNA polymerase sigma-70 factor (ECF subfamily)